MSDDPREQDGDKRLGMPYTSRSLPIALLRARERVMAPIRAMLSDAGVTEQQWRVLRVLQEYGEMEPKILAEHACLLLPSLTRIMQALEERGLITRARDARDGRKLRLAISEEGVALIASKRDEARRIFSQIEEEFGKERVEMLLDLLNELSGRGDD